MNRKKTSLIFRFIKWLLYVFYPRMEVIGVENLPEEPVIIAANHTQMNGPIACELYPPRKRYTWCTGEMMVLREVPAYAYQDFWSEKPLCTRWFYKLLSYAIAPLSVCLFNNADTIPVYKDTRILTTFRTSMNCLLEGADVVIFPECAEKHNHIIYNFQTGFVDIARMYHKKTGKPLPFVPMYIAPKLRKMIIGKPVYFNPEAPIAAERMRICSALMHEITQIAINLPRHTVIPYRNIPKKDYPTNISE